MSDRTEDAKLGRRDLLKGAAAGTVLVAALAAASPAAAQAKGESKADRKKSRYKETDHVKTFYRTNRY